MNEELKPAENMPAEENLIIVKQLPVIEEQLLTIKERFSEEAEKALSLTCTEETLQMVKKKRAEITKTFDALETKRKEAKKAILAPYEAFEKVYKECVTEIYAPCNEKLAGKIKDVEDELKSEKRAETELFFNEYCVSKGIDFLTFDNIGLNVTMSASRKSLKEQAKAFVDRVCDELAMIDTQEHKEEILVEYKKFLNVAQAVTAVVNRHKAIEEEKTRLLAVNSAREEAERRAAAVDNIIETLAAPTEEAVEQPTEAKEKRYSVSFKVIGTMEQIKALKEFLVKGEFEYEQQ